MSNDNLPELHSLSRSTPPPPVSEAYLQQIDDIRKNIESETVQKWEITLRRQGSYTIDQGSIVVGDFSKRGPYRVSEVTDKIRRFDDEMKHSAPNNGPSPYAGLEGDYPTLEAIRQKIQSLKRVGSIPGDKPSTWRCPKCSYGNNRFDYGHCSRPYTNYEDRCTYENEELNRWYGIYPDATCGKIYQSSGGSISICSYVAKLSILS